MHGRRRMRLVAAALALTVATGGAATLAASEAGASGTHYSVKTVNLPDGQHRVRWDPCSTITYAVNVRRAGATPAARAAAVADVRAAFDRAAVWSGLTFSFVGRTSEIPRNTSSQGWDKRQSAAEIVVAWVDQDHAATSSDLLMTSGGDYVSGTGGWVYKAWTFDGSHWDLAIGRGFVVINADHNARYVRGFGAGYTRGALLLHEIGHALGLEHVGSTSEIMYPTMLDRASASYKTGDRTGLEKVGDGLGCIAGTTKVWPQL